MPRAVDRRDIEADYDPTRSGTEFHFAGLAKGLQELLAQIIPQALENMKQGVIDFIKEVTGIDLSSPEAFLLSFSQVIVNGNDDVEEFVRQIFIAAGSFLGFNPAKLPDIDVIAAIRDALDGIDLNGDPGAVLQAIVDAAGDFFGAIRSSLLQNVPIGSIANIRPNMLLEGGFDTADTIHPDSDFDWSGTDGHTTSPLGCAVVTADGLDHFQPRTASRCPWARSWRSAPG
ncbi:hypothetical protein BN970_01380 [Mycolicibacterium conceptionense]|uniref:Uncharacterized protein n=1 Tax=Mycolicibacterium conceptionense TaxID=451644 RepID=A0A0U1D3E3_9MYCO|nr:hypothetical protein BN970_01380 [Mycolicibacterium conceptionense]